MLTTLFLPVLREPVYWLLYLLLTTHFNSIVFPFPGCWRATSFVYDKTSETDIYNTCSSQGPFQEKYVLHSKGNVSTPTVKDLSPDISFGVQTPKAIYNQPIFG